MRTHLSLIMVMEGSFKGVDLEKTFLTRYDFLTLARMSSDFSI